MNSNDAVTYQDIKKITESMQIPKDPFSFSGIKMYEIPKKPLVPKIKISDDFKYCSDNFRNRYNVWLALNFGYIEQEKQSMLMYHTAIFAIKQDIDILRYI